MKTLEDIVISVGKAEALVKECVEYDVKGKAIPKEMIHKLREVYHELNNVSEFKVSEAFYNKYNYIMLYINDTFFIQGEPINI